MGCRDRESNWQYVHFDPADGEWWCSWGFSPVYAAPRGYEDILAAYAKKHHPAGVRFRATFNAKRQLWEVRPIGKDRND